MIDCSATQNGGGVLQVPTDAEHVSLRRNFEESGNLELGHNRVAKQAKYDNDARVASRSLDNCSPLVGEDAAQDDSESDEIEEFTDGV